MIHMIYFVKLYSDLIIVSSWSSWNEGFLTRLLRISMITTMMLLCVISTIIIWIGRRWIETIGSTWRSKSRSLSIWWFIKWDCVYISGAWKGEHHLVVRLGMKYLRRRILKLAILKEKLKFSANEFQVGHENMEWKIDSEWTLRHVSQIKYLNQMSTYHLAWKLRRLDDSSNQTRIHSTHLP